MSENRRIYFNKDDNEIVTEIYHSKPFWKLNLMDVFALAMVFGKKRGYRTPLGKKKIARINQSTVKNSKAHILMMAIAVAETGSLEILNNEDDYFTICEEYAKTGLPILKKEVLNPNYNFVQDLEREALHYFDFLNNL